MASEKKTILVVLAHPDDESFGMGGTIAYYAARGVGVHLTCATRGEAGTVDAEFLGNYKSIAELREAELQCAAQALGLSSVTFLNYRDSGMVGSADNQNPQALVQAPLDEVAGRIVAQIRRLRPQVVVTFDPVGGYHHPDHIHVHQATLLAFAAAGDAAQYAKVGRPFEPSKLYYTALNRGRLRWLVRWMRLLGRDPSRVGRNKDIDLTLLTRDADTPPHVTINYRRVQKRKAQADACHASQLGGRFSRFSLWDLYYLVAGRTDSFTRTIPATPDGYRAGDLFAD